MLVPSKLSNVSVLGLLIGLGYLSARALPQAYRAGCGGERQHCGHGAPFGPWLDRTKRALSPRETHSRVSPSGGSRRAGSESTREGFLVHSFEMNRFQASLLLVIGSSFLAGCGGSAQKGGSTAVVESAQGAAAATPLEHSLPGKLVFAGRLRSSRELLGVGMDSPAIRALWAEAVRNEPFLEYVDLDKPIDVIVAVDEQGFADRRCLRTLLRRRPNYRRPMVLDLRPFTLAWLAV